MSDRPTASPLRQFADRINTPFAFRALLYLFGAVLLVFAAVPIANALLGLSIKDYKLWHDTGQLVLRGGEVYPGPFRKFPFMYPPTSAVLLAPISLFGPIGTVVILVLVNAVAWTACILLAVRLATGEWKRQHILLYAIPSAIVSVFAWSSFHLGQPSLVLLALLLGSFVALQQKRPITAGALVAFATSIKAFPFITIVYLLYRRYWIAAASMLLTLVFLLIVLPAPFRGVQQAMTDFQRWSNGMLKYDEGGVAQRPGRSQSWKNQSIFGVANRLLRHVEYDYQYGPHTPMYTNVADLDFKTVNAIIVGTALLFGFAFIGVLPRPARRTSRTDAIEFTLLLLLMLMFTPLAFDYLFAFLLFPFTVVVQLLLSGGAGKRLFACAATAVFLMATSLPFQRPAQGLGNVFFATAILFVALVLELARLKRSRESD
ncbi:MAG: DUF2029 domain-containing protein [Chthoniobacterales bacterium]|nr:DUF2029 domain-containing protein [Chthoniobacterales bacterium]